MNIISGSVLLEPVLNCTEYSQVQLERIVSSIGHKRTHALCNHTLCNALREKHPDAQGPNQEALLTPENPPLGPNSIIFDCLDADLIRHAAKQTNGSAGPSGLNANAWRKICCSFREASDDLCHALALVARRL